MLELLSPSASFLQWYNAVSCTMTKPYHIKSHFPFIFFLIFFSKMYTNKRLFTGSIKKYSTRKELTKQKHVHEKESTFLWNQSNSLGSNLVIETWTIRFNFLLLLPYLEQQDHRSRSYERRWQSWSRSYDIHDLGDPITCSLNFYSPKNTTEL